MKITYNEPWYQAQIRYQEAVKRAGFLSEQEKVNWFILGGSLTLKELQSAEKVIINEDLRRLKVRDQLEKIKPAMNR